MSRILIVDDEPSICWGLREYLHDEGHAVSIAASAEEALRSVDAEPPPDAVLLDVRLPGIDGLTAMHQIRQRIGGRPIVLMTAFGSLEIAVRAVAEGAFDYLPKPFDLDQAGAVVRRALESSIFVDDVAAPAGEPPPTLIGSSPVMQQVFKQIALVAPTDVPVLITGESGTGKELVARAIHEHSPRRAAPFVPVCLPALNAGVVESELFGHVRGAFTGSTHDRTGVLELAHGGTILLDEIADVPPAVQVKLLRALEQKEITPVGEARPRPIDIRIVAATNRPLDELIARGEFREDLFFRLSVFRIHLPPLRSRADDVLLLAEHFLKQTLGGDGRVELTPAVREHLLKRPWAGNVRELRNTIEHAAILARRGVLQPEHLPTAPEFTESPASGSSLEAEIRTRLARWGQDQVVPGDGEAAARELYARFLSLVEPAFLESVLAACGGNRAAAAQCLSLHRATLRHKLRRYGLG